MPQALLSARNTSGLHGRVSTLEKRLRDLEVSIHGDADAPSSEERRVNESPNPLPVVPSYRSFARSLELALLSLSLGGRWEVVAGRLKDACYAPLPAVITLKDSNTPKGRLRLAFTSTDFLVFHDEAANSTVIERKDNIVQIAFAQRPDQCWY